MRTLISSPANDFRLKKVEGEIAWCSNYGGLEAFQAHHTRWRRGHKQEPAAYVYAQISTTHKCWIGLGFRLDTYLTRQYMDEVEHDGAWTEVWRCTLRLT